MQALHKRLARPLRKIGANCSLYLCIKMASHLFIRFSQGEISSNALAENF